jgi:drug/metabolite transporter (DMT)-like permease
MTERTARSVYVFLAIGLVAASQSGNLIRIGDAHPTAIAAWRLLLASLMMLPFGWRSLGRIAQLPLVDLGLLALAGVALAGHLIAWIAAVQHTTVANASVFFAINPVLTAVAAYLVFGERMSRHLLLAVLLGIAGVTVIGAHDLDVSPRSFLGDALSLLCSVLFTLYFLAGKRPRAHIDSGAYVTVVYGVAGLASLAAVLALGEPVLSYSPRNWTCFVLMALVPTMIGHTAFNHALRYLDASRISAATLSEPAMAGLVAWWAWGEALTGATLAGYLLISVSVLALVFDFRQRTEESRARVHGAMQSKNPSASSQPHVDSGSNQSQSMA